MRRDYSVRGKRVTVDELEDVLAVRFDTPATAEQVQRGTMICQWHGQPLTITRDLKLPAAVQGMLERAGWFLMRRAQQSGPGKAVAPIAVGRVYRDEAGEVMIGLGGMTVRLRDELPESAAKQVLAKHGLAIKRQLKSAGNDESTESHGFDQKDPFDVRDASCRDTGIMHTKARSQPRRFPNRSSPSRAENTGRGRGNWQPNC